MGDAGLNPNQVSRLKLHGDPIGGGILHDQGYLARDQVNMLHFDAVQVIAAWAPRFQFDECGITNSFITIVKIRKVSLGEAQAFWPLGASC